MKRNFEQALDNCLDWMRSGASLESCLERFPDYSQELRPLLETAISVQQIEVPHSSQIAIQLSRQTMFNAVDRKFSSQAVSKSLLSRYAEQIIILLTGKENIDMKLVTRFAVATMVAILFIGLGGTAIASAKAIPGDTLYPVKTMIEDVKLNLTLNDSARQQLEERLQETRREEIMAALMTGRIADVQYWGEVTAINEDSWEIDGLTIYINENTRIVGDPAVGSFVMVKAVTQEDGTILAFILTTKGPFTGAGNPYSDQEQNQMQNHEQNQNGAQAPASTPTPDGDQDQDRTQDRDRDQTCDQVQDPTCEPQQDRDRDHTQDHNQDQDCDQNQDTTCDPQHDQDRDRDQDHDQNQDSTQEPPQEQNQDQDCNPTQEPHDNHNPGKGGGH